MFGEVRYTCAGKGKQKIEVCLNARNAYWHLDVKLVWMDQISSPGKS